MNDRPGTTGPTADGAASGRPDTDTHTGPEQIGHTQWGQAQASHTLGGDTMVGTSPIQVQLPAFDGPLDLLLHLIKRDEINIYDIPISHITGEYLKYIGMLQLLDLDVAGEFLVMAASLMRIKARMLLPPIPGMTDEEEDGLDPRDELVQQLLEYRRFKEAAAQLHGAEEARRLRFERGYLPRFDAEDLPELMPVGLYALMEVMKDVLARVGEEFFHEVILEEVSLEEKIALIEGELASRGRVLFLDLLERTPRKMHVVVTLMAVLELARLGKLAVRQEKLFGQIWLYPADLAPPLELEVMDEDAEGSPEVAGAPRPAYTPAGPGPLIQADALDNAPEATEDDDESIE